LTALNVGYRRAHTSEIKLSGLSEIERFTYPRGKEGTEMDLARKFKKAVAAALVAERGVNAAKTERRHRAAAHTLKMAELKMSKAAKRMKRAKTQKQMRDLGINY
jgi:hypothetical protein